MLKDAGLRASDIDEVVAVGGQTRTPAVMQTLQRIFGQAPTKRVNPDEAVAIGTAIQTGIAQGTVTEAVLLDVTPYTLGIETKDETFTPIIDRNANIPTKQSRIFTTVADDQRAVEVHALQGEGTMTHENTSLAKFILSEIPPAPAGEPQIEVLFEIDVNGIVNVTAMDQLTGRQRSITVHPTSGLTESEIAKARTDFERQTRFEDNLSERDRLAAELDGLVRNARRSLGLLEYELSDKDRKAADTALRRADEVREGSIEELRSALSDLESAAALLGQAILGQPRQRGVLSWIRRIWKSFWSS